MKKKSPPFEVRVDQTPSIDVYTIHDGKNVVSTGKIKDKTFNVQYPYSEENIITNISKIIEAKDEMMKMAEKNKKK